MLKEIFKKKNKFAQVSTLTDKQHAICEEMLKDEGKSDQVATYYYVKFCDAQASPETRDLYGPLIGRKFIIRCHKKFGLDRISNNLKLCFGSECVT